MSCSLTGSGYAQAADLPATPTLLASPSPTQASTATPANATLDPTAIPHVKGTLLTPPACTETKGTVQEADLPSALLPESLHYRIYLPPCYAEDSGERLSGDPELTPPGRTTQHRAGAQPGFPVLYLIHGLMLDDSQWDRIGADEAADELIDSHKAPPFIIVMPYDLLATEPSYDAFGQALAGELVPWIDAHYRTLPERRYRAIGGLSRGAGWAIHLGFSRWDLFASVGAHSLALFFEDTLQIDDWLKNIPPEQMPRAYLDIGTGDDELDGVSEFEAYLTRYDVPHEWHMNTGLHEDAYWSAHVEQYLRWYTAIWWN